jgi:hydrogenase expression/formation protein HypC
MRDAMCLAIPGRINTIEKQGPLTMANVDFSGVIKEVCIEWVPGAKVGDYVIVHAGFALSLLNEAEAIESLKLIHEATQGANAYHQW